MMYILYSSPSPSAAKAMAPVFSARSSSSSPSAPAAPLPAFFFARRSSAIFFFSSFDSFFSNRPGAAGPAGAEVASLELPGTGPSKRGFSEGGVEPMANESGTCTATPSAPPFHASMTLSQSMPLELTPPTVLLRTTMPSSLPAGTIAPRHATTQRVPTRTFGAFVTTLRSESSPTSISQAVGQMGGGEEEVSSERLGGVGWGGSRASVTEPSGSLVLRLPPPLRLLPVLIAASPYWQGSAALKELCSARLQASPNLLLFQLPPPLLLRPSLIAASLYWQGSAE